MSFIEGRGSFCQTPEGKVVEHAAGPGFFAGVISIGHLVGKEQEGVHPTGNVQDLHINSLTTRFRQRWDLLPESERTIFSSGEIRAGLVELGVAGLKLIDPKNDMPIYVAGVTKVLDAYADIFHRDGQLQEPIVQQFSEAWEKLEQQKER